MLLTESQANDHRDAALMLHRLPPTRELIGDRGYDSASFRQALRERGTAACIPSRGAENTPSPTTPPSTGNATRSRSCSAASRTGDASTPATTAAPLPSSQPTLAATVILRPGQSPEPSCNTPPNGAEKDLAAPKSTAISRRLAAGSMEPDVARLSLAAAKRHSLAPLWATRPL